MPNPWIEMYDRETSRSACALAAIQVAPRAFAERNRMRWGFNFGAAYDEARERTSVFIDMLYARQFQPQTRRSAGQRSLALRCGLPQPGEPLTLTLVAGVRGLPDSWLHTACRDFCDELLASFPYDYQLYPAVTREDFLHICGWEQVRQAAAQMSIVEIERKETAITPDGCAFVQTGEWAANRQSAETLWHSLALSPGSLIFNMLIQPVQLLPSEKTELAQLAGLLEAAGDAQPEAAKAASLYRQRAQAAQGVFCMQLHLVAPAGVPASISRTVGSSLTAAVKPGEAPGGFTVRRVPGSVVNQQRIMTLQPVYNRISAASPRGRLVACAPEVRAAFHLPFFSEFGVPDVEFAIPTA